MRAALSLVLAFVAGAALWMLMEAEFLSLTLILVYVGAVAVLFLFVVMMLDVDYAAMKAGYTRILPLGIMVSVLVVGSMILLFSGYDLSLDFYPPPFEKPADHSSTAALGQLLFTEYLYPFEIAGGILLVAIISAISLTFRGARKRKSQKVGEQVAARPEDNVRLVKMASETKRSTKREGSA